MLGARIDFLVNSCTSSFSFEKLGSDFVHRHPWRWRHGSRRLSAQRCLYSNCARCTVRVQTRVDHRTRMYDGQRLAHVRNLKICKDFGVPRRLHIRLMTTLTNGTLTHFLQSLMVAQFIILLKHFAIYKKVLT